MSRQFFLGSLLLLLAALVAPPATAQLRAPSLPPALRAASPYVDRLTGEAARKHLDNLRARHPRLFERAAAVLKEKGFRDTGRIEVVRSNRAVSRKSPAAASPYRFAETVQGEEGEIVYWQWDDGNYDNWEGNIHILDYTSGNWINVDAQMLVTDGEEWYEEWSYPIGGYDNPRYPDNQYSLNGVYSLTKSADARFIVPVVDWDRVRQRYQDWAWCASAACAGSWAQCWIAAGRFPDRRAVAACAATACIGVGIGCLAVLR